MSKSHKRKYHSQRRTIICFSYLQCPMTPVAHGGNPQDRAGSPMPHALIAYFYVMRSIYTNPNNCH
ncbi:MAG: hypothetical protein V7L05_22260 [Nostoc sp.]|uniref:hypothetical protein n=1 Tax=Nostoc sp. TaxID=1180 RepID=UPI002FF94CB2